MKALLLLLLATAAGAQDLDPYFALPLFKDGLYTRYSANAVPDGALPEALNVTLDDDVDGVVVARRGYSKYNTSAITASKTIRGLWAFDATDGTKYLVAFSSQSFYRSTGDGTWAQISGLTGFSLTKEFDCTQTIGKLWCGNGDVLFYWDGTSTAAVSGAPLGNLVGRFRNRVLISGISGSKGRVRGSGELDGTDYTLQIPGVSTTPFSIAFGGADDGEDVTCLMGAYQDVFVVGKRNSLWGLYGFGRNDFQVREISREVGCIDRRSVREKNNCLYWLSLRGIEKFCGANIERISDPIRDKLDTIVATAGNPRSAVDTSQSDFEAGNLTASGPGAPVSTTISPGSMAPSSSTLLDNTTSLFALGTFEGCGPTSRGDINFAGVTSTYTSRHTGDSSLSGGGWSLAVYTGNYLETVAGGSVTIRSTQNDYGTLTKSIQATSANRHVVFRFGKSDGGSGSFIFSGIGTSVGEPKAVVKLTNALTKYQADVSGTLISIVEETIAQPSYSTFTIILTTDSAAYFWRNGVFKASSTVANSSTTATHAVINNNQPDSNNDSGYAYIDFFNAASGTPNPGFADIPSVATFTSRIFNTGLSTPTFGNLLISSYPTTGSSLSLSMRVSTSPNNDLWGSFISQPNDAKPATARQQYVQYKATFTASNLTEVIGFDRTTLDAATTGYFISQCRNPATAITSWGLFSCTQDLNNGNLTYAISTGTTCNSVTRSTATWNTQANNTEIALATSAYVAYRVLFDIDSASESPKVRDCTINWLEGESRPPVASSVYRDRYYLAYTSSTAQGSSNDHLLVLDKNDKWTLFNNHNCYSLVNYERNLYCGSSTDAGQVWRLDNGTDDDGTAISSIIRTKAFNLGLPERPKLFKRLYLDLEPSPDPTQTITLTGRYLLERSTPTYSLGTVDLNEDPGSIMTSRFPFPLLNPVSGRYIQVELQSSGLNSPWRLFGGRLYFKMLDPE